MKNAAQNTDFNPDLYCLFALRSRRSNASFAFDFDGSDFCGGSSFL